tara:strand:+ start:82 stop:909 length:828 start_codon:yes stop_codon:yes gene_type:complete
MVANEKWFGGGAGAVADFYSYQIEQSCYFNGTSSKLTKTFSTTATTNDKVAISVWIKRNGASNTNSAIGSTTNTKIISGDQFNQIEINTNNPVGYSDQLGYVFTNSSTQGWTYRKFRDVSGWYHFVLIYDSTLSTANDRIKFYVNGDIMPISDSTLWNTIGSNSPSQNADVTIKKSGGDTLIGAYEYDGAGYFGGTMAEFIVIDGTATIDNFGEFKKDIWVPKDPSGLTFGNNGFYLKFADGSNLGLDSSGNSNNFTASGLSASSIVLDSPTFGS